jgi:hypothetical protein
VFKFESRLCLYLAKVKESGLWSDVDPWLKLDNYLLLFDCILGLGSHLLFLNRCWGLNFFEEMVNGLLP